MASTTQAHRGNTCHLIETIQIVSKFNATVNYVYFNYKMKMLIAMYFLRELHKEKNFPPPLVRFHSTALSVAFSSGSPTKSSSSCARAWHVASTWIVSVGAVLACIIWLPLSTKLLHTQHH